MRAALLTLLLLAIAILPPANAAPLDAKTRQRAFDMVWSRVKERHYDPTLGGVDWNAVRRRYAPRARRAKSDAAFYTVLQKMLGELKQSHFNIIPPDAYRAEDEASGKPGNGGGGKPQNGGGGGEGGGSGAGSGAGGGDVGLTVQIVEEQPVITRVETDGPGARAGLRPGFVLTHIDNKPLAPLLARMRSEARTRRRHPAEADFYARFAVAGRLGGPAGESVRVGYRDGADRAQSVAIVRREPPGKPVRFGNLPPIPTEMESRRLEGGVGYVRFNIFLAPLLEPVQKAIVGMRDAPGIILDLRGNVGGLGIMAPAISRAFFDKRATLGTMKLRTGEFHMVVFPEENGAAYKGPLVILTDEASLSTSEIMAGGLQENGRATVVGRRTAGMVLPSQVEMLPGGARLQYVFADFKTPKGVLLEGRGVVPNIPAPITRRALLDGRDPILDAALAVIARKKVQ